MAGKTTIPWCDWTLNIVDWRCAPVVDECDNCYAETWTDRWQGAGAFRSAPPRLKPGRLLLPWLDPKMRAGRRGFLESMSDPFHPGIPYEEQVQIWGMMGADARHEYQVLSKRPDVGLKLLTDPGFAERVRAEITRFIERLTPKSGRLNPERRAAVEAAQQAAEEFRWPLQNVLVGVSVGQQSTADKFVPKLLATPAEHHFLSVEPMIGPVDLDQPRCDVHGRDEVVVGAGGREWCVDCSADGFTGELSFGHWLDPLNGGVDWVIVGGESGKVNLADPYDAPKRSGFARPMELEWARSVMEQCKDAGVPVFSKQLGAVQAHLLKLGDRKGEDWTEWPVDLADMKIREFPQVALAA